MSIFRIIIIIACIGVLSMAIPAQAQERYTVSGASLMSGLVESYIEGFQKQAPEVVFVVQGATTGKGFKRFIDKEATLIMASREMSDEEIQAAEKKGLEPKKKLLGKICVAVICNESIPVDVLSMEQLRRIFTGAIKNWKEVGGPDTPIVVTTRAVPETGTGVLFQKEILRGAPYAEGHAVMQSYGTTAKVCANRMAIGYMPVSSGYYKKLKDMGAKTIGIKMSEDTAPLYPAMGAITTTEYPVTIPFYFYWDGSIENKILADLAAYAENQVH